MAWVVAPTVYEPEVIVMVELLAAIIVLKNVVPNAVTPEIICPVAPKAVNPVIPESVMPKLPVPAAPMVPTETLPWMNMVLPIRFTLTVAVPPLKFTKVVVAASHAAPGS